MVKIKLRFSLFHFGVSIALFISFWFLAGLLSGFGGGSVSIADSLHLFAVMFWPILILIIYLFISAFLSIEKNTKK